MPKHLWIPILAITLTTACQARDRAFTPADADAIRAASAAYSKAEMAGDFEKWFAFSTADAIYMPEQSRTLQGHDALAQWFAQIPRGGTLDTTPQEITGHGDIAVERGSYVGTLPAVPGAQPLRDTGNYMVIWERQADGNWKITRAIWNADHE